MTIDPAALGWLSDTAPSQYLSSDGYHPNAPFFDELVVKGHRPLLAVVVEIDDIFFHCAKAFLRSGLWNPATWAPEAKVPRRAVIAKEVEPTGMTVEQLDDYYAPDNYAKGLYAP